MNLAELEELNELVENFKLNFYTPYEKQKQFHHSSKRERLFMAGNQLGKTWAGAYEVAMHLTGIYPDWWEGARINKPNKWWVAGESGESTRDNPQRLLLGEIGELGTGAIPKDCLGKKSMARGVADLVDHIAIKHVSGGMSHLYFKSYGKGREKWQGETINGLWFDEEPPADVYSEGITRTNKSFNDGFGRVIVTFTPLKGMSSVVSRYWNETDPEREIISMTIDDVEHYTDEIKQAIINSYPEHEREARAKGIPMLGEGRVFPITEDSITDRVTEMPNHWPRICGMDFGWGDHPTAACMIAWDRDADVVHLYSGYKEKSTSLAVHAAGIKALAQFTPVAWPHDGNMAARGRNDGKKIRDLYSDNGLNMVFEHAKYEGDRGNSVEASVADILDRMETGRFKVAPHLEMFWEEFRMYHRKDGKIVPKDDDFISAVRYAVMMLRFASAPTYQTNYSGKIEYPPMGIV